MIYKLLEALDKRWGIEKAEAHCDIPCGIYDPITAQIAALTVVRMIDLMNDYEKNHPDKDMNYSFNVARYTAVKEEHAEKVKHDIRVIFGDYIKQPQLDKYPDLPALVHKIYQLGSKGKQTADRDNAVQLVEAVNQFAQIFWDTKGIATKRAKAPYAPNLELVYPNL
ncbi:MAG: superoxide dismutase, Ni [Omnitrophica WOR_2 bacterium]